MREKEEPPCCHRCSIDRTGCRLGTRHPPRAADTVAAVPPALRYGGRKRQLRLASRMQRQAQLAAAAARRRGGGSSCATIRQRRRRPRSAAEPAPTAGRGPGCRAGRGPGARCTSRRVSRPDCRQGAVFRAAGERLGSRGGRAPGQPHLPCLLHAACACPRCRFKKELKKRKIPVEDYAELRERRQRGPDTQLHRCWPGPRASLPCLL